MRRASIFIGLTLLLLPSSGDAGFPAQPDGALAWLYETAERVRFDLEEDVILRKAVAPLMGFASVDTPLCPSAMLSNVPGLASRQLCTVIGVGKSTLDTNRNGRTSGTFDVVVDISPPNSSVHVPDLPVMSGTFEGDITSVPELPLLSLAGRFQIRAVNAQTFPELASLVGASVSFTGTFRIPIGPNDSRLCLFAACYFFNGAFVSVQAEEFSVGFPLVRLEIQSFGELERESDDQDQDQNDD